MRRSLALIAAVFASSSISFADDAPNDSSLGAKPPKGEVVLFNGKSLDGWVKSDGKTPAAWPVEDGIFRVGKGQGSIMTEKKFGDFKIHVEFNVP